MEKSENASDRINLRVPPDWFRAVRAAAHREGLGVSGLIRAAVNAYLRSLGIEPPAAGVGAEAEQEDEKPRRAKGRPKRL